VAFWNVKHVKGFNFLPFILLVECKNTGLPVSSEQMGWFNHKLQTRGRDVGILVAAHGITGTPQERTAARQTLSEALSQGREIVIITRQEIEDLGDTEQPVRLVQQKLCELVVSGTAQ
jgi:hypothetical protein